MPVAVPVRLTSIFRVPSVIRPHTASFSRSSVIVPTAVAPAGISTCARLISWMLLVRVILGADGVDAGVPFRIMSFGILFVNAAE